ncbi:MAG: hypothetical protein H6766_00180 [Candidatus Peribacteria bacterium]|nr:MAG: hypothetical protein H6766_00180 [Candidatus Peribacteria bacterium]
MFAGTGTEYDFDDQFFTAPDRHYPTDIQLPGDHNRENICLINALMHQLCITPNHIYDTIKSFTGLPHRMQLVSEKNGIRRIDDSQSTNPSTCVTAVRTFGDQVGSIMLGGYQSHFDYTEVMETIRQYPSIQTLILFPDTIHDFRKHIKPSDTFSIFDAKSMAEAVDIARDHTPAGTICLMSPGAKSFSLRTSMSERGDQFLEYIEKHS